MKLDLRCKFNQLVDKKKGLIIKNNTSINTFQVAKASKGGQQECENGAVQVPTTGNILHAAVAASHLLEPSTTYQYNATRSVPLLETLANFADATLSTGGSLEDNPGKDDQSLTLQGGTSFDIVQAHERKKFTCAVCGSVYATHSGLSRHKRKHLDRPQANEVYPCELCAKTYQSRQSLLRHIGEQHGNTLYKCQFCR